MSSEYRRQLLESNKAVNFFFQIKHLKKDKYNPDKFIVGIKITPRQILPKKTKLIVQNKIDSGELMSGSHDFQFSKINNLSQIEGIMRIMGWMAKSFLELRDDYDENKKFLRAKLLYNFDEGYGEKHD